MGKRHDLEGFKKKTIAANTKWLLAEKNLPQPIEKLHLWSDQGRLEIVGIVVRKGDDTREIIHGDYPSTTMPFDDADDELLTAFMEKNELDEDAEIYWGDYFGLPEAIYRMEMIRCAHAVADNAKKKGVKFAPGAKIGIRMEDEDYEDPATFEKAAQQKLRKLDEAIASELVGLFYADVGATKLLSSTPKTAKKKAPKKTTKKKR
jgi:hypothetical protein